MRMNGAEIIIKSLGRHGIDTVSGIPGGANLPIYDALSRSSIRHILARHEQGAGFIAHGMARSTGKPAVCLATSGPGATNLITAIADAYMDSVPVIAITGQVPSSMMGTNAFQEVDTIGLSLPVTKKSVLVSSVQDIADIMDDAFYTVTSGRPGPVMIIVPKDIQLETIDFLENPVKKPAEHFNKIDENILSDAARAINESARPVLYIGGGVIASGACNEVYALAAKNSIPAALTLMGLGCFPPDDGLYLGMLGMHGELSTNVILDRADLLIAIGVRFDDRATGRVADFCKHASVIHVDIDHSEIDKIKKSNISVIADAKFFLQSIIQHIEKNSRPEWIHEISRLKADHGSVRDSFDFEHPAAIIRIISSFMPDDAIITTDVGQHQMWTAQNYPIRSRRTFLTSGGLGTMGFGLPAAIGAALANQGRKVLCISGDGSILMNIQELATLSDYGLDVKIIIMNNSQLGLVRQQQELFYNGNICASRFITNPDFASIGRNFGIESIDLEHEADPLGALGYALAKTGPILINIPIREEHNVLPMVQPGKANVEMIV